MIVALRELTAEDAGPNDVVFIDKDGKIIIYQNLPIYKKKVEA